jgi:uncharacterized protein YkwD
MSPKRPYIVAIVTLTWLVATPVAEAARVQEHRAVQRAEPARASGPTAPATCPGQKSLAAPVEVQLRAMRCLVNFARLRAGLEGLAESGLLNESASRKAADIMRCDSFSHFACGRQFNYWMREGGYMSGPCWRTGEDLAWGLGRLGTARSSFQALMRSTTHREVILGEFNEIGVSLRSGHLELISGVRLWVLHFGLRC